MAAPAGRYDITSDQFATFERTITWKDSTGTPVNLTGYTARLQVRSTFDDSNTVVDIDETGGITLGGVLGTIAVSVPAADMGWEPGSYVWDLVLENGATTRLLQGSWTHRAGVTQ